LEPFDYTDFVLPTTDSNLAILYIESISNSYNQQPQDFFGNLRGGVDIHFLQVKIGLNFRTAEAELVRYV